MPCHGKPDYHEWSYSRESRQWSFTLSILKPTSVFEEERHEAIDTAAELTQYLVHAMVVTGYRNMTTVLVQHADQYIHLESVRL